MNSAESDEVLIRRLRVGEAAAFDALFDRYRRGVLAYVTGMLGDRALAEDVTQETFLTLLKRIDRLNPRRGASAWLYRVARNRAIDLLRHRRFEVSDPDSGALRVDTRTPVDEVVVHERSEVIERALGSLPVRERDLLLLRFYGGLTFREVAAAVRRPLGTVLWQVRRSLKKLEKELGREEHT